MVSTLVQGVNFSIVLYGASGTGKTYAFGGGASPEPGLAQLFIDSLFPELQTKRTQYAHGQSKDGRMGVSAELTYKINVRFVEIVNEELTDLLSTQSSFGHNALAVTLDEWEGPSVEGVQWINVTSSKGLKDLFIRGSRNRTKRSNQFGALKDKATAIFTIVVEQRILIHGEQNPTLVYSQFNLVELPGCEILQQPEEDTAIRQGPKLNQAIFAVNKVTDNLSKSKHGDFTYYEASQVTQLLTDIIGGNSITNVIFTLKSGDLEGSSQTLQAIQKFKKIRNYPLVNDSRVLGLLRKYRMILLSAQAHGGARSLLTGDAGQFQQQLADMERRIVSSDMEKLRILEQKRSLASRSAELKMKYNEAIQAKADMQTQLINSQEEKLKISKALIDLQIELNNLQQAQSNLQFQRQANQIQNEARFIEKGMKQQKTAQAISDYQQKLQDSLNDKKQMEIQYVALRKNYLNIKEDYEKQKNKSQLMQIEIVNLVNENKAMSKNSDNVMRKADGMSGDIFKAQSRAQDLQRETYKQAQALINAQKQISRLQSELARFEVKQQQYKLDFDSKKIELEKEIVNLSKQKAINADERRMKTPVIQVLQQPNLGGVSAPLHQQPQLAPPHAGDADLSEQERQQYIRREKDLERKIQKLNADLEDSQQIKIENINERNRSNMSLEENRTAFRNKLSKIMDDQGIGGLGNSAKDQLVRSYVEKENDMIMRIERLEKRLSQVRG